MSKKESNVRQPVWDVFDIHNDEHIGAWKTLQETGTWPREFWEQHLQNCSFPTNWQYRIASLMADEWLKERLAAADRKRPA